MTRDEAIEAGARALRQQQTSGLCHLGRTCDLCDCFAPHEEDDRARRHAAAVLDAIGWVKPVGYLAPGVTALLNAYPTLEEARASGWGGDMYALVPVEVDG